MSAELTVWLMKQLIPLWSQLLSLLLTGDKWQPAPWTTFWVPLWLLEVSSHTRYRQTMSNRTFFHHKIFYKIFTIFAFEIIWPVASWVCRTSSYGNRIPIEVSGRGKPCPFLCLLPGPSPGCRDGEAGVCDECGLPHLGAPFRALSACAVCALSSGSPSSPCSNHPLPIPREQGMFFCNCFTSFPVDKVNGME